MGDNHFNREDGAENCEPRSAFGKRKNSGSKCFPSLFCAETEIVSAWTQEKEKMDSPPE